MGEKGRKVAGILLVVLLASGYAAWQGMADLRDGILLETGEGGAARASASASPGGTGAGDPSPTAEMLRIHLAGAVVDPGIYEIAKGSCLDDLVRMAGGFASNADTDRINLVWRIERSLMIRIGERSPTGEASGSSGETGAGPGVQVTDQVVLPEGGGEGGTPNGPIDLNAATIQQLDALPGVGPSTAAAIVAYREKNGPFAKKEDLMKVPGIKQSRFDAVKDLISVG